MKHTFFITPTIWTFLAIPILGVICCIIMLIFRQWYPALASLIVSAIFIVPLIIWRKIIFAKIEISNEGLSRVYKNEKINSVTWDEIVEIRALPPKFLYFLKNAYEEKQITLNYKTNICFWLTKKKLEILLNYKNKFQNKISDVSILAKQQQELLLDQNLYIKKD